MLVSKKETYRADFVSCQPTGVLVVSPDETTAMRELDSGEIFLVSGGPETTVGTDILPT